MKKVGTDLLTVYFIENERISVACLHFKENKFAAKEC